MQMQLQDAQYCLNTEYLQATKKWMETVVGILPHMALMGASQQQAMMRANSGGNSSKPRWKDKKNKGGAGGWGGQSGGGTNNSNNKPGQQQATTGNKNKGTRDVGLKKIQNTSKSNRKGMTINLSGMHTLGSGLNLIKWYYGLIRPLHPPTN